MTLRQLFQATVLATGLAAAGVQAAADTYIFDHVTLIDGTGLPAQSDMTVVVSDGRFARVVSSAAAGDVSGTHIDGRGKYLIPGLMDMHIHLRGGFSESNGKRVQANDHKEGLAMLASYLYAGVTAVYDSGNNPDFIFGLRADERAGKIQSPRIFATGGFVTYPGSHGDVPGSTRIDSWPAAKKRLDAYAARKPDLAKIVFEEEGWGSRPMITILPVDLMQHAIEYLNDYGIRTTAHVSSEFRARQVIFAGIDDLSHPDIQGPVSDKFVRLMVAKQIPMVTTLTIGENYHRLVEHPEFLDQPLYRATFNADEIHYMKTTLRDKWAKRTWTQWMKIMTPIAQQNVRRIDAAGGIAVSGTDKSSGAALHRELELLADAGIKPLEIIRIATLNGAIFLGRERDMGSIARGKLADAVLLSKDPTVDIDNTKAIVLVMKGGRIIDESKLPLAGKAPPRQHPQ